MPALNCNPSVIEPLNSVTVMSAASTSSQPQSRVLYQAKTPDIIKVAPMPATATDITTIQPAQPTKPQVLLPDITKMSQDLLTGGQLLADIPIAPDNHDDSVLRNLQPGADPTPSPENDIHHAVQLAKTPLTADTMARSSSWPEGSELVKQLILGLAVIIVIVAVASIWWTAQESGTSLTPSLINDTPRIFEPDTVPAATLVK
jgi:hypothetical protein